ncbi:ABC transporter ATP-binding protein [Paenibacillus flagellatus]|uniref:ABC transporter ATP-binding protein n=1 Tax=Paenibacillus flagellatus TaxID=2211139 RepID=A0A2V5K6L9_9BACL|nr:ABC transporter ATP-binding protein [Paenibacillus flagellatus]PYI55021.1 ABC transporter ATP-binding protein [Paenibacillus flagellatus]
MGEPIIELRQLTKKYGEFTAVDKLTLTIERGEIFGLLGPNGAGKSTTILMMLGLAEPTMGIVKVCGVDPTRHPLLVKRKVGYLPDDVGFYEDRSGLDNLIYSAMLNRIPREEARERALRLLERVGLADAANKKTGAYSRGMRQRLGLADVLIKRPEMIVLDEPTLGIDPEGVRELLQLIRSLSRDEGITVLLSSHHLHQVQQICDRVGLFVKGKLIAVGDIPTLSRELFEEELIVVEAVVRSASERLSSKLGGVDGVLRVQKETGGEWRIGCSRDVSAELARAIVEDGAALQRLSIREYGLDEIYHRYFEGGESR